MSYSWRVDLYLTPSRLTFSTAGVLCVLAVGLAIIIALLHAREKVGMRTISWQLPAISRVQEVMQSKRSHSCNDICVAHATSRSKVITANRCILKLAKIMM